MASRGNLGGLAETASGVVDVMDAAGFDVVIVETVLRSTIEAGIAERPVLAILPEVFRPNQEGTLHFRYLIDGGLLTTSRSIDEHLTITHAAGHCAHSTGSFAFSNF